MKVLVALSYYRPHISGLTIYTERLSRALARRGHDVTVLTSRYDRRLPRECVEQGVRVLRLPVLARLSKGVLQPTILFDFWREAKAADLVHIHLPQGEGGVLAFIARRLLKKPVIVTYHCDLILPPGLVNRIIDRLVAVINRLAVRFADHVVTYTTDFAKHSALLATLPDRVRVVPPPIELAPVDPKLQEKFRAECAPDGKRIVAFVGRFAADKGLEYLLRAVPLIVRQAPDTRVVLAGPFQEVIGERVWEQVRPVIGRLGDSVKVIGAIPQADIASFFSICDVLTLPSINSTESFGMVQVEAMFCGVPVVASDLPGVRQPVTLTGMGRIVPPRDAESLAKAVVEVLRDRASYVKPARTIHDLFSTEATANAYEALFAESLPASRPKAAA